ncbi:mitochondrial carrier protein, putative [Pediculus humanus corporis]|uniref:Mitochondrial carrier protein, putative n=1 Tax=Pediculus humanus subsp. corporis TaxID=121224 RepID=E0W1E8_PEDHC|nr:mitochondrial carrier protein, putative [Pediculus humanus corporis]EEB19454.1 mitochondrial carrier protein, putative [Pediculus humanus corporis]
MDEKYDDRVSLSENATRFIKKRISDIGPTLDSDDSGIAGVFVDFTLYPLDTIKTRLQSKYGFRASGGFRGIYKGIVPVILCSAPLSALFFATYNTMVNTLKTENSALNPVVYIVSASAAELIGSIVRVPLEVVKQRKQTSNTRSAFIVRQTLKKEGVYGLYRGFWSTLWREIPFAAIQYPVWEVMINEYMAFQDGKSLNTFQTALCGAFAGAIAAAFTTPMDVIKTRIMLEEKEKIEKIKKNLNWNMAKQVYSQKGIRGLFAGIIPRILWITLGGFLYFGAYEKTKLVFEEKCEKIKTDNKSKLGNMAPTYIKEETHNNNSIFSKEKICNLFIEYQEQSHEKRNDETNEKEIQNLQDSKEELNEKNDDILSQDTAKQ